MAIPYIGRFAPSPSGPLHLGSLLAAVASYLDARKQQGKWLLRMEDLDPVREPAGAAQLILDQLQAFSLFWDDEVLYQSSRIQQYEAVLADLTERNHCYFCDCSRAQVRAMGQVYNGSCRHRRSPPRQNCAVRLKTVDREIGFDDLVQGHYCQNVRKQTGDFVIKRKDQLIAYQLAVVVDDEFQGVNHVIRGVDLLDSTPRQIYLQQLLAYAVPRYGHIPVLVNEAGQKLSKQHFAAPLELSKKEMSLHLVLQLLGLSPPAQHSGLAVDRQLQWALENWDIQRVPKLATLPLAVPG